MVGPHVDPGVMGYLMCGLLSKSAPALREFFIDNLLVRVHFIIVMIRWTGLAPWERGGGGAASARRQAAPNTESQFQQS